ncbi:MAG: hypothetical protein H5U02_15140 [Clostridia bacterium]|nr:hypothetical protein [Clostridia bacterium]
MAEKKGLLSRIFGKQGSGCCDVRIEEIPEEENREQATGKNFGGSCCCGGPVPNAEIVNIDGKQTGIVGLKEAIAEVKKLKLTDQEQIKDELLARVRQRNYISPGREKAYREALWREYQEHA